MVYSGLTFRSEFKDKVFGYCQLCGITIQYSYGGSYDVYGYADSVSVVNEFIEKLENNRIEYRKYKSFIWRIFN